MVSVPIDIDKDELRILKVCFYSNSFHVGKNFKLVKCTVMTEIRVSVGIAKYLFRTRKGVLNSES